MVPSISPISPGWTTCSRRSRSSAAAPAVEGQGERGHVGQCSSLFEVTCNKDALTHESSRSAARRLRRAMTLITIEGIDGAGKSTLAAGAGRGPARRRPAARARRRGAGRARARGRQGPGPARRRPGRGAAVRGGARPAGRGGRAPAAGGRADRAAGPLRRLVAGLPGRRPRARRRGGAARSTTFATGGLVARPHAAAARWIRRWRGRARARAARPSTAWRPRATASSRPIAAAYDAFAAADPARWAVLDATRPPDALLADAPGCACATSVRRDASRPALRPGPGLCAGRRRRADAATAPPPRPRRPRRHGGDADAGDDADRDDHDGPARRPRSRSTSRPPTAARAGPARRVACSSPSALAAVTAVALGRCCA